VIRNRGHVGAAEGGGYSSGGGEVSLSGRMGDREENDRQNKDI